MRSNLHTFSHSPACSTAERFPRPRNLPLGRNCPSRSFRDRRAPVRSPSPPPPSPTSHTPTPPSHSPSAVCWNGTALPGQDVVQGVVGKAAQTFWPPLTDSYLPSPRADPAKPRRQTKIQHITMLIVNMLPNQIAHTHLMRQRRQHT